MTLAVILRISKSHSRNPLAGKRKIIFRFKNLLTFIESFSVREYIGHLETSAFWPSHCLREF